MEPLFGFFAFLCPMAIGLERSPRPMTRGSVEINSMWIDEVAPERLAELFHHYHEALSPEKSDQNEERGSWKKIPQPEKSRLVAAARLALLELESTAGEQVKARPYFAQPGEAEW